MDGDEGELQLPEDTLAALQDFYKERDEHDRQFEKLKLDAEHDYDEQTLSMSAFAEDWNASQFWYSEETALKLSLELLKDADSTDRIAVVSAPSVFVEMKKLLAMRKPSQRPEVKLLEYDGRFAVFKEFVEYDFNKPTQLPEELKGSCNRIICDPPFLSEECQTKSAITARWLARSWDESTMWLIVCTGERMANLIHKLYAKVKIETTSFLPRHAHGLSNEFRCYSNIDRADWNETRKLSTELKAGEANRTPAS